MWYGGSSSSGMMMSAPSAFCAWTERSGVRWIVLPSWYERNTAPRSETRIKAPPLPGADLLLGSDVTYDESCAGALCDSLARALAAREGCRAVLSHEHRMHGSDDFALQAICDAAAARGLAVACRGSEPLRPGMSRANAVWGSVLEVVQGNGGPQCRGCGLLLATGSGARCEWCRKRNTG